MPWVPRKPRNRRITSVVGRVARMPRPTRACSRMPFDNLAAQARHTTRSLTTLNSRTSRSYFAFLVESVTTAARGNSGSGSLRRRSSSFDLVIVHTTRHSTEQNKNQVAPCLAIPPKQPMASGTITNQPTARAPKPAAGSHHSRVRRTTSASTKSMATIVDSTW